MRQHKVSGLFWSALMTMGVACGPPPELVAERDALKQDVERLTTAEKRKGSRQRARKVRSLERQLADARREVALARIGVGKDDPLAVELQTSMGTIGCALSSNPDYGGQLRAAG